MYLSECFTVLSDNFWIATYCSVYHICRNETHEVIKYLEYCVHRLHNEDPGVHNLLLSLYAKQVEYFYNYF